MLKTDSENKTQVKTPCPLQAKPNSRTEMISKIIDYVDDFYNITFAYIFGSFARGRLFRALIKKYLVRRVLLEMIP